MNEKIYNNKNDIIDIKTIKKLMKANPMKTYVVKLDNSFFVEMRLYSESDKKDDVKLLKSANKSFKEGWEAAMKGDTKPISKLWTNIE